MFGGGTIVGMPKGFCCAAIVDTKYPVNQCENWVQNDHGLFSERCRDKDLAIKAWATYHINGWLWFKVILSKFMQNAPNVNSCKSCSDKWIQICSNRITKYYNMQSWIEIPTHANVQHINWTCKWPDRQSIVARTSDPEGVLAPAFVDYKKGRQSDPHA